MRKLLLFSITALFLSTNLYAQNAESFEHSYWQWVTGSEISDKKLNEIAPHFPHPKNSNYDMDSYEFEIQKWQKLYCFEYERFVNAPELVKLNPYYTGYVDIVQVPYFIRTVKSREKPVYEGDENDGEAKIDFELDVQAWYFVFHPNDFYRIYQIDPEFPESFDEDLFRKQIIDKMDASKDPNEDLN